MRALFILHSIHQLSAGIQYKVHHKHISKASNQHNRKFIHVFITISVLRPQSSQLRHHFMIIIILALYTNLRLFARRLSAYNHGQDVSLMMHVIQFYITKCNKVCIA